MQILINFYTTATVLNQGASTSLCCHQECVCELLICIRAIKSASIKLLNKLNTNLQ